MAKHPHWSAPRVDTDHERGTELLYIPQLLMKLDVLVDVILGN
jgi:hypothetical protein